MCVKNFEESAILPYLQANVSARHSFMDVDRTHKTPGSEMKDYHSKSISQSVNMIVSVL